MGFITKLLLHIVSLLFLHSTTIFVLNVQGAFYTPKDNYLIACGSSTASATDSDGRKWVGDESPPALPILPVGGNLESVAASTSVLQNQNLPDTLPFLGARISTSVVSYRFPVTPGRHWLRLYFYPFAYENYDPDLAIVTVYTDKYMLVTNMSITREMHALNLDYIRKEFSINVTANLLEVSFIPGTVKDAYAMVNGIEVISMPDEMFASSVHNVDVSEDLPTIAISDIALETMYRVNVGGRPLNAANDELSRTWDTDIGFIPTAAFGVAENTDHSIQFTNANNYTAPQVVYQTARTMTNSDSVNLNFNLTWHFSVIPAFTYYVRLHFCEFDYPLINMRVFDIFINSELAVRAFDVNAEALFLTGNNTEESTGQYRAVVMDFATSIASKRTWGASNIVVALHPTNSTNPTYFNSILNGLEIFKLNDSSGNLQGPPPPLIAVPSASTPRQSSPSVHGGLKKPIIGGVGGAAAVALALLFVGCFVYICMHRHKKSANNSSQLMISEGCTASPAVPSYAPSNLSRNFTFQEISFMTNNFDEARVLGVGGFGKVYQGVLEDGLTKVAVKRGRGSSSKQGVVEFQTEIKLLSKLRHRHLVSLIGYCEEHNEMILVYDCMANGPLKGHLYGTDLPQLSWKQRLEICIGAARGLHYLHTGSPQGMIIHRDVKTTNILLDENLIAKVSDFGLSRTGPTHDHTHVSTAVKGTFGYLDPEYFRLKQLTDKSDVYSFGVVLMEVVCARPAISPTEEIDLAEWAILKWKKEGMLDEMIDPFLVERISRESMNKFAETAERCLQDCGSERPTMGDVLWSLEYALELHESSVEKALDIESKPQTVDPR